jgi:hypothetical protein
MKNILNNKPVFLNDWSSKEDLERDFEISLCDINVLFATYSYQDYNGEAFVLFEKDGKLYEVNGGHCSCYGLEGQWEPEETNILALKHRLYEGTMGQDHYSGHIFSTELKEFLK